MGQERDKGGERGKTRARQRKREKIRVREREGEKRKKEGLKQNTNLTFGESRESSERIHS